MLGGSSKPKRLGKGALGVVPIQDMVKHKEIIHIPTYVYHAIYHQYKILISIIYYVEKSNRKERKTLHMGPVPFVSASRACELATQELMICRHVPSTSRKRRPAS